MNGAIAERLKGKRRVHVDSMVVIYFIERNPDFRPVVRPLFELLDAGELLGISSYITLLEILVHPIRKGNLGLAQQYRDTLVQSDNFSLFPVDQTIAEEGARIRARYEFRTPDAIQLATAVRQQADVFVTNDKQLKRFDRLEVLLIDDLVITDGQDEAQPDPA